MKGIAHKKRKRGNWKNERSNKEAPTQKVYVCNRPLPPVNSWADLKIFLFPIKENPEPASGRRLAKITIGTKLHSLLTKGKKYRATPIPIARCVLNSIK